MLLPTRSSPRGRRWKVASHVQYGTWRPPGTLCPTSVAGPQWGRMGVAGQRP